jgi:hypothetical protein
MPGEETSVRDRSAERADHRSSAWTPYRSPSTQKRGLFGLLRRYSFSITVVLSVLAVGALIYFSPTRLDPRQNTGGPTSPSEYSTLSIYAEPVGAAVIVGADTVGTTPVQNHRLPAGTYLVTVTEEGYVDRDTVLTLSADASLMYAPQLRREDALSPPEESGPQNPSTTAASRTDPAPDERQSSEEFSRESDIASSEASREQTSSPESTGEDETNTLAMGGLTLRSVPGSTAVKINGYGVGSTPMRLDQVAVGTHELTFSRPGYTTVTKRVEVRAGDTATVTASLEALTGHLRVLVHPWGSIYLNGERHAQDLDVWYETELQAGTYTVTARHPSLGETARTVQVAARDTQSVVLNMREE